MVVKSPNDSVVSVRPMRETDLDIADRIMRLAFGTLAGLADPMSFLGDAGLVRSRWRADPSAAFVAEMDNQVVASNFAANWGSVGFFGPLTVRPDPGPGASERFDRLLDACDSLAANEGVKILIAGVNMGRHEAYRQMINRGFRTDLQGVAMQRGNDPGYNRPGVFLIDDWR